MPKNFKALNFSHHIQVKLLPDNLARFGHNVFCFIPQIAIAIGVLTSNRGEGDEPLWRIGRGTRVPLQGAGDVVPLQGAIVMCYGGEEEGRAWCHCKVPL